MLAGLAEMLGAYPFTVEHIRIDDGEAERLAGGFAGVARWYDIPEIGERAADHYSCAMAIVMVYGMKLAAELADRRRMHGAPPPVVTIEAGVAQPAGSAPPPGSNGVNQPGQPPDPRNWRTVDVDGVGKVDIPPPTATN